MTIKIKYIIIAILAFIAIWNSFYLAYDWLFSVENTVNIYAQIWKVANEWSKFCDINELFSCSKVTSSEYSQLFWIPFSIFSIFNFILIFILSIFWIIKKETIKYITIITWLWVIFNFYLFYLEIFVIKAFCPVCIWISISLFSIFFISLSSSLKCTTKQ